jgi:hypothetical protein
LSCQSTLPLLSNTASFESGVSTATSVPSGDTAGTVLGAMSTVQLALLDQPSGTGRATNWSGPTLGAGNVGSFGDAVVLGTPSPLLNTSR